MPVQIHLVRHAQGFHNLSLENEALRDPLLTDLGKQQCAALRSAFPHHSKLTHLVASPLRRTLHTCLLGFATPGQSPKVIALPEVQEVSDAPCDTGSAIADIEAEFDGRVDFSRVPENWTDKKSTESRWEPTLKKLEARAAEARRKLRDLADGDGHVVVVTHGAIVHFLTNDFWGIAAGKATGWENTEYRSYTFADDTGKDPNAYFTETQESWERRQGDNTRPSPEEQAELQRVFYRDMEPYLKYSPERGWMQ
ncbi:Phosphoglycerate mutase-like protein [Colletotrichum orbiculare MAFF 240422]|uniref:Phosphoglycerate mutase-like protein n=1 Tax=Colletotrichum orbiculare (strain 104-T / ATCC 96160 / CBS 514.97 / LARS 414 / MAFF 240422) TaxID=1213857 RepID=A0A484G6I7_COLOR|nr:Phosphoglycerate mutase-like protein [Colletotrichum orbiculare MAFF 240422]